MDDLVFKDRIEGATVSIEDFNKDNFLVFSIDRKDYRFIQHFHFNHAEIQEMVDFLTKALTQHKETAQ